MRIVSWSVYIAEMELESMLFLSQHAERSSRRKCGCIPYTRFDSSFIFPFKFYVLFDRTFSIRTYETLT